MRVCAGGPAGEVFMLWKSISISNQERALVARNHHLQSILTPGKYRIFTLPGVSLQVERHNVTDLMLRSKWTDYLLNRLPALVEQHFVCVRTNEVQVAMVYANGELFKVLTPASRILIWRDAARITAEVVDVLPDLSSDDSTVELDFSPTFVNL
jgi:hypothetical protein